VASKQYDIDDIVVYNDGNVCISILHPPGKDEFNEQEQETEKYIITY